jgi:hypothetical protein
MRNPAWLRDRPCRTGRENALRCGLGVVSQEALLRRDASVKIVLELDPAAAVHLALALRRHRDYCERYRYATPQALAELERLADTAARGGRKRKSPAPDRDPVRDDLPAFLTRRAFAQQVGRSERTIRSWIRSGRLFAGPAGIPRSELDRLKGER